MFPQPSHHFWDFWQLSQTDLITMLCFPSGSLTKSWLRLVPTHKLFNKKILSANLSGNLFTVILIPRIKREFISDDSRSGIRTIINLQTPGEHSHCGQPLTSSGFSYLPEIFMEKDSYIYILTHIPHSCL